MYSTTYSIDGICSLVGVNITHAKGSSVYVDCPLCGGKNKLNVNLSSNTWRCNRCGEGGGMIDMYQKMMGISTFDDAKKLLRDAYNNISPAPQISIDDKKRWQTAQKKKAELAPAEVRNQTYSALLNKLTLARKHCGDLMRRGLSEEAIIRGNFKSIPQLGKVSLAEELRAEGYILRGVPGFYTTPEGHECISCVGSGYFIPVRNAYGQIEGMQIRYDNPSAAEAQKGEFAKYKWFTSSGDTQTNGTSTSNINNVHFAGIDIMKAPHVVYITEGPLKATIANYLSEKAFIAIPGVNNTSCLEETFCLLKYAGVDTIVEAFDMDRKTNPHVAKAVNKIHSLITDAGFISRVIEWNDVKGIDDFLLRRVRK